MSEGIKDSSVFGDEDNNPFPHSEGVASIMHSKSSGKAKKTSNAASKIDNNSSMNTSIIASLSINGPVKSKTISYSDSHFGNDETEGDIEEGSESLLLFQSDREQPKTINYDYESRVIKLLHPDCQSRVEIIDAGQSNEGMSHALKKYVVYTIKLLSEEHPNEEIQTRRRYSDFESLRDTLSRIFPLIVIPPIPPKNYFSLRMLNGLVGSNATSAVIGSNGGNGAAGETTSIHNPGSASYSYINSNHLNKIRLIEHRKRLLANFLNRCLRIRQIRSLEFFAKFLDPSANWSDEIVLIGSQLPKSIFQLNPENGLHTDPMYAHLPVPTSSHPLGISFLSKRKLAQQTTKILNNGKSPEQSNMDQPKVDFIKDPVGNDFESDPLLKISNLDDINKRIVETLIGMSSDYVELGTELNSFSLSIDLTRAKSGKQSEGADHKFDMLLDRVGIAFDRSQSTYQSLIAEIETRFSEPLGEAVQYSGIFSSVKKFHDRKLKQNTILEEEINDKKKELFQLEKVGNQSRNSVLNASPSNSKGESSVQGSSELDTKNSSKLNKFIRMGSLKKITRYVSDMIDQNPEQTRKDRIGALQTKLAILKKCQTIMLGDIVCITDEVSKSQKLFQLEQLQAIFRILLHYNSIFIAWAQKNIQIWEEIKEEIKSLAL